MRIQPVVAAVALLGAAACGGGGGGYGGTVTGPPPVTGPTCTPGGTTVCLGPGNTFNPTSLTVTKGATVTWDNETSVTHNVTFDTQGAPSNTPNFSNGMQTRTFPTLGTYKYHCSIHGGAMSGTIVVQ